MGEKTGIAWTDSTLNFWIGCTKVGPGCDNCYAVGVGKRLEVEWGPGAPRRRSAESTRNNLAKWQRQAPKFLAEHGHKRRVFCSSLADIFDNEVPDGWRMEAFKAMEMAPDCLIQICTKRVSNVRKMVPASWSAGAHVGLWPENVGLLITVVTKEEVLRDVPRLLALKRSLGIPWVGLSLEPLVEDVHDALEEALSVNEAIPLDWMIIGGESGFNARPYEIEWAYRIIELGRARNIAVFHKQLGALPLLRGNPVRLKDSAGADPTEWPAITSLHLETRQFPPQLEVV